MRGKTEALEVLLEGARVEDFSVELFSFYAPVHSAVHFDKADILEILLKRGFELHGTYSEVEFTALHLAVFKGRIDCVKVLLKYGVDVNIGLKNGDTPLIVALQKNQTQIVSLLLEHGADPIKSILLPPRL